MPKRQQQNESSSSSSSHDQPPTKKANTGKGGWQFGLFASMNDPNLKIFEDDRVVVIKDKYPKARYHFLIMPKEKLDGLQQLKGDHVGLLEHMKEIGQKIASEQAKDDEFRHGFHIRASMSHLHMHTISQDFDSTALKTKKHWNSFTTDFFRDVDDILHELRNDGTVSIPNSSNCDALLKQDLKCHKCENTFKTIPKLKDHLKKHDTRKKR